jgi:lipoate-protein ligase A
MKENATQWRLIVTPSLPGAQNMAIDEALLRSFNPGTSSPVLRLYGWEPAALSLGRFQKGGEILDLERCRTESVPVVRRITGGGVIFHADELTYSIVCAPDQIPPASSVKDSFRVLTGFLLTFYRGLGLEAAYAVDAAPEGTCLGDRAPFCFAGKESFDILIDGRKIGGNAQRRQKGIIFQHGSIPVLNRALKGLSFMKERTPRLARDATSLDDCGVTPDYGELRQRLTDAFRESFKVKLLPEACTEQECSLAEELLFHRYLKDCWNLEGVEE